MFDQAIEPDITSAQWLVNVTESILLITGLVILAIGWFTVPKGFVLVGAMILLVGIAMYSATAVILGNINIKVAYVGVALTVILEAEDAADEKAAETEAERMNADHP